LSEPTNEQRAAWARDALDVFGRATFHQSVDEMIDNCNSDRDSDLACAISDLICDLMHLADQHGLDPYNVYGAALTNYEAECEEATEDA
jgi:hypothetical protein